MQMKVSMPANEISFKLQYLRLPTGSYVAIGEKDQGHRS